MTADNELKIELINSVLEYATQMNTLELSFSKLDDENPEKDYFPEYKKKYLHIFKKYCTDKKRSYGGQGDSYGEPAQYDGIENSIEQKTELKTKSRAEVYFKTKNSFDAEYLFVLLKKSGEWKIDSAKYKWYKQEKWKTLHL